MERLRMLNVQEAQTILAQHLAQHEIVWVCPRPFLIIRYMQNIVETAGWSEHCWQKPNQGTLAWSSGHRTTVTVIDNKALMRILCKSCCFHMMFTIGALLCLQKLGATPTLVETRCIRCTGWKSAEVRLKSAGIGAKKSSKGYSIIQSALHMCHMWLHIAGRTMVDPMQELESANAASQSSNNLDPESTRSSLHPIAWRSSRLTWPFA